MEFHLICQKKWKRIRISKIQNDLFEEEMEEMPLCTESESSRCGILDEEDVFTIDL